MPIGVDPRRRRKYVLRAQRTKPESEQTWFTFRRPSLDQEARILDMRGASGDLSLHQRVLATLRAGGLEVDDAHPLRGEDGAPATYDAADPDALISLLSWEERAELAAAVMSDGVEKADLEKPAPSPAAT